MSNKKIKPAVWRFVAAGAICLLSVFLFTQKAKTYTVTWQNYDGTALETQVFVKGIVPQYTGEVPQKPADEIFMYAFAGWDKKPSPVTEDQVYTALFAPMRDHYHLYWNNDDGTLILEEIAHHGDEPSYKGETPVKADDEEYSYVFDHWEGNFNLIDTDREYTAVYKKIPKQ